MLPHLTVLAVLGAVLVLRGTADFLPALEHPDAEAGSGSVQEPEKVYMAELIAKLNDLFGGDTTDQDKLRWVNGTLLGKVADSGKLREQAQNNSKMQFANSPDLKPELENAIIASYDAHSSLSKQALNSPAVLRGLLDVLINHSGLYERLREDRAS